MKPFLRLFFFCIILMHLGSASTMAHDGTVYIVGTVKSKTCIISPDSENLIVRMSDVATGQFTNQKIIRHGNILLSILKTAAQG
ncbi:TPA: hypothetical protein ACG0A7_001973 [Enterobacter roggenkampii]|nr:hypothetical protein [Enterobacter roggenkampii]